MKHLKTYEQVNVFDEETQYYDIELLYNEIVQLIDIELYKKNINNLDFEDFADDRFDYFIVYRRNIITNRNVIMNKILSILENTEYSFSYSLGDDILRMIYHNYNIKELVEDKLIDILEVEPILYTKMKDEYRYSITNRLKSAMEFYEDGEELGLI